MDLYFRRAEHMAWLMSKCPATKTGDVYESLNRLTPEEYFEVTEWAFNYATRSTPAFSDAWIDKLIVEAQLTNHDLGL